MEIYLIAIVVLLVCIIIMMVSIRESKHNYEYSKHLYKYYHIQRELQTFINFNWEKCSENEWKLTKDFSKSIDDITEYIEEHPGGVSGEYIFSSMWVVLNQHYIF